MTFAFEKTASDASTPAQLARMMHAGAVQFLHSSTKRIIMHARLHPLLVCAFGFFFPGIGTLAAQETAPRYLIVHADDAGMSHSANRATIEAMEKGSVSSASIMVPCPWFPEIAEYARQHPEQDFGIHLTLNAEWKHYRWGPVASCDKVPSLIDDQGFLWARVEDVARNAKTDEVEIELRAQIDRALAFGVPITHLDTHMGALASRADLIQLYVSLGVEYDIPVLLVRSMKQSMLDEYPELAEKAGDLLAVLEQKRLPVIDHLPTIPGARDLETTKAIYLKAIQQLAPGVNQVIIHCGHDDPELRAITARAANRDFDRRVFTDAEVAAELKRQNIRLISWRELREIMPEQAP
jgi:predicted glycoside hydrolase/deacetylase ChbG (UPF0249 family)